MNNMVLQYWKNRVLYYYTDCSSESYDSSCRFTFEEVEIMAPETNDDDSENNALTDVSYQKFTKQNGYTTGGGFATINFNSKNIVQHII